MVVYQSTTTQTDLISTFFLVTFIYFGSKINDDNINNYIFSLLSLFLGALVKYTTLIFAIPFLIYFLFTYFFNKKYKNLTNFILLFFLISFTILFPFFYRNYQSFGSILGTSDVKGDMINSGITFKSILSNLLKNIFSNFNAPLQFWNDFLYLIINYVHRFLSIPLDSVNYNFGGIKFDLSFISNEDINSSIIHTLIPIFAIISFFLIKKNEIKKKAFVYLMLTFSGLIIYSAIFKWQPFGNRLLLPVFVISIFFGFILIYEYLLKFYFKIIIFFLIYAMPVIFLNSSKLFVSQYTIRNIIQKPKFLIDDYYLYTMNLKFSDVKPILKYYDTITEFRYELKPDLNKSTRNLIYNYEKEAGFFKDEKNSFYNNTRLENYFLFNKFQF